MPVPSPKPQAAPEDVDQFIEETSPKSVLSLCATRTDSCPLRHSGRLSMLLYSVICLD